MRLQPGKCMFRSSTVRYCGHVLTENGLKVDWDKVKAVSNMNKPTNREELRRFLGLVAYVAKFLLGHVMFLLRCESFFVKSQYGHGLQRRTKPSSV